MGSLDDLVIAVSFAYGAAVVGLLVALISRAWDRIWGRTAPHAQAAWRVWLPPMAVVVLPLSALLPHPGGPVAAVHDWWHSVEAQLHSWPEAHAALHAANYGVLVLAFGGLMRVAHAFGRMRSFAEALRLSNPQPADANNGIEVRRLPLAEPLCFAAGFRKTTVYVSDGLEAALCPRDREAVLAHEAAHVRRFDPAAQTLLTLFYCAFPLPGAGLLLAEWQQSAERECDAAAANQLGSPTDVATALVRVAQVMIATREPVCSGATFLSAPEDVAGRVQALLHPQSALDRRSVTLHLSIALLVLASAGAWLFHAVELFVRH